MEYGAGITGGQNNADVDVMAMNLAHQLQNFPITSKNDIQGTAGAALIATTVNLHTVSPTNVG